MHAIPRWTGRAPYWLSAGLLGLFSYSFVLTLARATTLPFMAVYLSRTLKMEIAEIGVILSFALAIGTVASLFGGFVIDRFRPVLMLVATAALTGAIFSILPLITKTSAIMAALSILYAILAVSSIVVKTTISQSLPEARRVPAFSLNYTLVNVAFAIGPLISVYLIASDFETAFFVAAIFALCAALIVLFIRPGSTGGLSPREAPPTLGATIGALRRDFALLLFTVGGLLSAVVYDQFSAYLSQYLITQLSSDAAYTLIGQIVTANALVVIATQILLGRQIRRSTLLLFVFVGTGCLIVGLIGFSLSTATWIWIAAMAVFTIGEVILVPSEYLYVDLIAPASMRGVYFALHNLSSLGGAASPALCGLMLAYGGPVGMFAILIACAVGGAVFYTFGHLQMIAKKGGHDPRRPLR